MTTHRLTPSQLVTAKILWSQGKDTWSIAAEMSDDRLHVFESEIYNALTVIRGAKPSIRVIDGRSKGKHRDHNSPNPQSNHKPLHGPVA